MDISLEVIFFNVATTNLYTGNSMKVFTVYTCKTNKEINTGRQTKKNTLAKTNNEKRNVIKLLINKISNFLSSWRQSMSP